ncbi:MAG TPA: hypothetical protein VLT86_04130 [Vicinamibacterales bacterium]|nr:hypothetical protein [Vicinamibacterales bacterium]
MAKTAKARSKAKAPVSPSESPKAGRALRKAVPPPDNPLLRQQGEDAALPGVSQHDLAAAREKALRRR